MMHVLMTADTVGGVWTYAVELAAALRASQVRVTLATMGNQPSEDQRRQAEQAGLMVYQSRWKLEWMHEPWDDVAAAGRWLMDLQRALVPDVIHLNSYAHADLPWAAPVVTVAHSCVLSWFHAVRGREAGPEWNRYRSAVRRGLSASAMVIAPTRTMLQMLQRCHGPTPAAQVIFNGIDPSRFPPGDKQAMVFSAGRWWDPAKNLAALDDAAAAIQAPVVVAGDMAHPDGHDDVRPPRHVRTVGRQTPAQMARWLAKASIYALPACYEPFGLTALEAAAAGCALVLGDLPTFREIWGDDALYVPPHEPGQLAATVNQLLADDVRRQCLAHRARQRALTMTAQRLATEYHAVYRRVRDRGASQRLQATA